MAETNTFLMQGACGSVPGQGTGSYTLQLRPGAAKQQVNKTSKQNNNGPAPLYKEKEGRPRRAYNSGATLRLEVTVIIPFRNCKTDHREGRIDLL